MKFILSNWKTTLTGIGTIIGGVVLIANGNYGAGATAIVAGIGQILAKDGSNNA
jgi:hypothetical protein